MVRVIGVMDELLYVAALGERRAWWIELSGYDRNHSTGALRDARAMILFAYLPRFYDREEL